ncbi:MAG: acyltransferase family protein [Lactobacillus porci]|nr:acyltransferase family protein [Lactobacillus porci]
MKTNKWQFSRQDTKALKGVAILLMLMHHLLAFPDRLPIKYQYAVSAAALKQLTTVGSFGKICVYIFMFLGGLGLAKQIQAHRFHLLKKIWGLYRVYWRVFLIFVPLGFLFFSRQPRYSKAFMWNRFARFSFGKFLQNLTGYASSYNGEWWFVRVFVAAIFLGTIYYYLTEKINNVYLETGLVLFTSVFTVKFLPALIKLSPFSSLASSYLWMQLFMPNAFICSYLFGIVFGKYDVFANLRRLFSSYNAFWRAMVGLLLIACAFYFQENVFVNVSEMMLVITPVFMTGCLLLLDLSAKASKVLRYFGRMSTNLWLIHTFFCYYFYPFTIAVFWSRNPLVAYLTLLLLSLLASVLLKQFYLGLGKLGAKLGQRFVIKK